MNPIPRNESESDEQFVYTLADRCFAYLERHGEDAGEKLTDEQHTLMAYVFLDSQVQEGGFLQLIATGYGDYILANPPAGRDAVQSPALRLVLLCTVIHKLHHTYVVRRGTDTADPR